MVLPIDEYRSVTDFMEAIQGTQGDTYWLLKPGEYWHGGIHLYDGFAGNAVYREGCHGLKCMTDGHVVAWRLNDDYQTAQYGDKLLKFSSTFALIKSTCIPDMNKSENALDFYTLWMQIAPLSEYGAEIPTATVTASSLKVRQDNPVEGWVRTGLPDGNVPEANSNYDAPLDSGTTLPRGSVVEIEEEATFLLSGQPQPFIFVRVKSVPDGKVSGLAAGESGWITGQDQYINRQSSSLPVWMQTAREHGVFNQVVSGQSIEVKAGDVIGHLSYHERPEATPQHFCHLEVFSQDERLEDFLANKASVTAGATELHTMADKTLWQYSEDSEMFVVADIGGAAAFSTAERLTPESECHSKESGGKTWYEIPAERAWMSADDVEKVNQFDLEKRGFIQLAEKEEPQSIFQTPEEGWLHQAFGQLAELTQNEARDGYSSGVAESYQKLLQQMDTNQDGLISANELWRYLHNTQRQIQYQVQRLVVKHHSEWLKDGMTALWQTALDEQREGYPELALYNMEYINKLVWMKDVSEIHSSEALWHMHPVVFLDAIKADGYDFSTRESTIRAIVAESKKQGFSLNSQIAYILATVKRETGDTFQPVREGDWVGHISTDDYRRTHYRYYPYYGRGYVQITWEYNYRAYSEKLGTDLVTDPDKALDPNNALFILIDGFKNGVFTGKKLIDYVNSSSTDFFHARRCINGLDHAEQIKSFAVDFLSTLDSGEWQ